MTEPHAAAQDLAGAIIRALIDVHEITMLVPHELPASLQRSVILDYI